MTKSIIENITPEVLAKDIQRYLSQDVNLDEIYTGAMEQGIDPIIWEAAINLISSKKVAKRKKVLVFSGIILVIIILLTVGILFFLNKSSVKIDNSLTNIEEITEEINQKKEIEKLKMEWEDDDFREKIENETIEIIFKNEDQKIFDNFEELIIWLEKTIGSEVVFKKIVVNFDENGKVISNYIEFIKPKDDYIFIFSKNTKIPFAIKKAVIYKDLENQNLENDDENLPKFNWQILLSKLEIPSIKKENTNLEIEIYRKNDENIFKVSLENKDTKEISQIEASVKIFQNVQGVQNIAIGKTPIISTGVFTKKHPIKKGPRPSS